MAFTPEQEAALLALLNRRRKTISDLESVVDVLGDMIFPVENGQATYAAAIDDIKDYILAESQEIAIIKRKVTLSNNASSPNNKIDFSDSESSTLLSTKILQSSGAWAAGSGNNGLLSGSVAAGKTYHWFKMLNPTTGALDFGAIEGVAGVNPDPTSVLPSGFTKWKRVGSVLTDISGGIRRFYQSRKFFELIPPILELSTQNPATSFSDQNLTTPLGLVTRALIKTTLNVGPATSAGIAIKSLTSLQTLEVNRQENDSVGFSFFRILTDTNSRIQYYCSSSVVQALEIALVGWEDYQL